MKSFTKLFFSICFLLVAVSCSDDSDEKVIEETPRYYVKYTISTQYVDAEGELRDDKGQIVNFKGNGEYIYGPVDKGFNAYLNVTYCNRKTVGQILVSIYEEPFALKVTKETNGETFKLSYTIE